MTFQEYAGTVKKDPSAIRWYGIDLSADIGAATIASASWSVPAGLTKLGEQIDGATVLVRLAGGGSNMSYPVTCHFVLSTGDEDDASIQVRIVEM